MWIFSSIEFYYGWNYYRPAIRLSALMKQQVIYITTHDSIGVGEDGPTHQPIEHLSSLRAIPNLYVFRPADAKESGISIFETAVENVTPSIEVRPRRIGGATYQVPVEVRRDRAVSLALRWIAEAVSVARKKSGKSSADCLQAEMIDAYNKRGGAFKIYEEKYKMAEANKAFSHLSFSH